MIKDLITVVVPVYNVEDYLERCLESIGRQTYEKIEVILVNDGSIDRSGEICDKYAALKSNFRVVHQPNGGLSAARNTGIDEANGEFISFVDSDDFIANNFIEHLYNIQKIYKADISICQHQKFYSEQSLVNRYDKEKDDGILNITGGQALEDLLYRKSFTTSAWGKLYRIDLFDGIRFPLNRLFEDLSTTYKLLAKSKHVSISRCQLYFYFQRSKSIMHSSFSNEKLILLDISKEILTFVKENEPGCINAAQSRYFVSCIQLFRLIPNEMIRKDVGKEIKNGIKSFRCSVLFNTHAKATTRVMALIACINVNFLRFLGKMHTILINKFHIKMKY